MVLVVNESVKDAFRAFMQELDGHMEATLSDGASITGLRQLLETMQRKHEEQVAKFTEELQALDAKHEAALRQLSASVVSLARKIPEGERVPAYSPGGSPDPPAAGDRDAQGSASDVHNNVALLREQIYPGARRPS